jgi:hypothetical protein
VTSAPLTRVVGAWKSAYGLSTAYAEPGEGSEALAAAGFDVAAPFEGAPSRDVAVVEGAIGDDWGDRAARAAALCSKAVVVVTPAGRAPGARPIEAIAPHLWRLGRVREREAYDFAVPFADVLPTSVRRRLARHEAFLVDIAPRTPQARLRRRLRQAP